MIKAVLIYDKENQASIYGVDYTRSIKTAADLISGFVSAVETLNNNKHLIQGIPESIPMDQFVIFLDDDEIRIRDGNGVHTNIHLHENDRYKGVLSLGDKVNSAYSNMVFETLVGIIDKNYKPPIGLNKLVRNNLNQVLKEYIQVFNEIN